MPWRNNRGFTLIEVLIAIVILATGLVMIMTAMGNTQQALRISENMITASQILDEQFVKTEMELISSKKLSSGHNEGRIKLPGREFLWTREVRPYQEEGLKDETRMNQVEMAILWQDGPVRKNEIRIVRLMMNRDLKEKQL